MKTAEIAKIYNRGIDLTLGAIGFGVTFVIFRCVNYQGRENIEKIDYALANGGSVLLASDHPGDIETVYTAGLVPRHLHSRNKNQTGVLLKEEFVSGKLGFQGRIALDTLAMYRAKPLPVKTPKYVEYIHERSKYNLISVLRINGILRKPGGLVLTFASGTRSRNMLEAEDGLGSFASLADWVVPLTTVIEKRARPKIVVGEPIPGKTGVERCTEMFGIEDGRRAYADLVMSIMAIKQPNAEKRGFYEELAGQLESYMRNPTEIIPRFEDERTQKMMMAYILWRAGGFERVREK